MMTVRTLFILLTALLTLSAGCAKIPPESVELSVALGNQIANLEQAHLALLDSFFSEKERQIDQFIREQWAPTYQQNLLNNSEVSAKWDAVVRSGEAADRIGFFNWISPIIQQAIITKRQELLDPLAESERLLRQQLQESYLQAYGMNDSLTRLLDSAATLQSKREHYQRLLGIEQNKINEGLGKVDAAVATLLNKTEAVEAQTKAVEAQAEEAKLYIQSLRDLARTIRGKGE